MLLSVCRMLQWVWLSMRMVPDNVCVPPCSRMNLHVGVLHYTPSCEPFPLLADPEHYEPNTLDMGADNAFPVDQYRCAPKMSYDLATEGSV